MIINRGNLSILNQAFNGAFKTGLAALPPDAELLNSCVMQVPSTTSEEKYAWLGAMTKFREWIGERKFQNLRQHDYAIKNKTFENTVSVNRDVIEDDQYGIYTPVFQQLGQDAAVHPFELAFGLLAAGTTTKCYDGQYFFDTDHPVGLPGAEVSVSNYQTGAAAPWYLIDASKVIKPIILQKRRDYAFQAKTNLSDENVFRENEFVWGADARLNVGFGLWQYAYRSDVTLDAAAYEAARAAMGAFRGDNGVPLNARANILLVGPSNEGPARRIVQAETGANGATNVNAGTAKVVVCPWLS